MIGNMFASELLKSQLVNLPMEKHPHFYKDMVDNYNVWNGLTKNDLEFITKELKKLFPELFI